MTNPIPNITNSQGMETHQPNSPQHKKHTNDDHKQNEETVIQHLEHRREHLQQYIAHIRSLGPRSAVKNDSKN